MSSKTLFSDVTDVTGDFDSLISVISKMVKDISGNQLGEKQSAMVKNRIKGRMLELRIPNCTEYSKYLDQNLKAESGYLVSLLTTHYSFFFREFLHFEFFRENLDKIVENLKLRGSKTLKIWSAACSRGQEVYSLAMFLQYHLPLIDPNMDFEILGTDIDPESVKIASNGVYRKNEITKAPMRYIGDNFSKGTGEISDFVRVKEKLRKKCKFDVCNLLEFSYKIKVQSFDIIFCRNVFIYFDINQVKKVSNDFFNHIYKNGFLVTGISETLTGLDLDLNKIGPSVWSKQKNPFLQQNKVEEKPPIEKMAHPPFKMEETKPIRVLCVDDSSTILKLLQKILNIENGFEIVATACNGIEAAQKVKEFDIDVVTLDIHMPIMGGVTYLEQYFGPDHPPVLILSSVSREDSKIISMALKAGASDIVEKPALNYLNQHGEEIRTKLKVAFQSKSKIPLSLIDQQFMESIKLTNLDNKIRILISRLENQPSLESCLKRILRKGEQPPIIIFYDENPSKLEKQVIRLSEELASKFEILKDSNINLKQNVIYVADYESSFKLIKDQYQDLLTSFLIFERCRTKIFADVLSWKGASVLVEDIGVEDMFTQKATDTFPWTSFAYMSNLFFYKGKKID